MISLYTNNCLILLSPSTGSDVRADITLQKLEVPHLHTYANLVLVRTMLPSHEFKGKDLGNPFSLHPIFTSSHVFLNKILTLKSFPLTFPKTRPTQQPFELAALGMLPAPNKRDSTKTGIACLRKVARSSSNQFLVVMDLILKKVTAMFIFSAISMRCVKMKR